MIRHLNLAQLGHIRYGLNCLNGAAAHSIVQCKIPGQARTVQRFRDAPTAAPAVSQASRVPPSMSASERP